MQKPLYLSADDFTLIRQALDFNAARWTGKDNPSLDLLERLSTVPVFPGYALIHPGTLPVDVAPFLAGFECPDCDVAAADVPRCTSEGCPLLRQLRGEIPADLPPDLPARSEFTPAMVDALRRVDNFLKGSQDYEHGQMRDGSCPALIVRTLIRGSVLPPADKPPSNVERINAKSTQDREALREMLDRVERKLRGGIWTDALWEIIHVLDAVGQTAIRVDANSEQTRERVKLLDGRIFNVAKLADETRGRVNGLDAEQVRQQGTINGAVTLAEQAKADALDVTRTVSAMNNGGI